MIYKKSEARIAQYLEFLDRRKYRALPPAVLSARWEYGITDRIYRSVPTERDMEWHPVDAFPHSWGEDHKSWWFRSRIALGEPGIAAGGELFLEARPQTDSLVFVNGEPAGALNPFHGKLRLRPEQVIDGKLDVAIEAWAGHTFPGYHPFDGPRVMTTVAHRQGSYPLILEEPRLLLRERAIYDLYYDLKVLFETAGIQEEGSLLRSRLVRDMHRGLMDIDFTASETELREQCAAVRPALKPLLKLKNGSLAPRIYSLGNAHLDHAWLWPMAETSRKSARTCANMLSYLDEYPEFRFLFSQPVQMVDLKENYPAIFAGVKRAVDRGQWEPNGGMWVEADCNLAGGESLIRQFLMGRKATRELFGYTGDVLWLPDVFGYTAGMPQILAGCGIKRFVTSKISWNDTTRFPFDLFRWQGIDGTVIPTHFITTAYEGLNSPEQMKAAWDRVQHKDCQDALLRSIGEGDGGGGTMRADIEMMRRMEDLQGLPRNRWAGLSEALEEICPDPEALPLYKGELYLELHRGTYTTMAALKRMNRKLEYALREQELREVRLFRRGGREDLLRAHAVRLEECWKGLLTLQFHDILPGTSIGTVNREALEETERLSAILKELAEESDRALGGEGDGTRLVISNSLPWKRRTLIDLPSELIGKESSGRSGSLPVQTLVSPNGGERPVTVAAPDGLAWQEARRLAGLETEGESFEIEGDRILTPWHSLKADGRGGFSSLVLRSSGREICLAGESLNELLLCDDLPVNWDAWDIEADYRFKEKRAGELLEREVLSRGPLVLQIRQSFRIGKSSTLTQDILLYRHSPRIDFATRVDWQERHSLLRVNFPSSLQASDALFDIPFGYIRRDTHGNTPGDRARFEVCAHKWASLADPGCRIALMSDCKYGYRVEGGELSLTLLRAPGAPDPEADRGAHEFTYSFLPLDEDDLDRVVKEGWDLNIPAAAGMLSPGEGEPVSLFGFSSESLMAESVKVAEDGESIILRVWETRGAPLRAEITPDSGFGFRSWELCNMLEDPEGARGTLDAGGDAVSLDFRGFEIKTVRFSRRP